MPKFEAKQGDFAKIWQKLGGYSPPGSAAHEVMWWQQDGAPAHTSNATLRYLKATFHLTISMCGERATGKIQRHNYHHGSCGASLTGKTMSVYLIFTQGTHRNVKNR